MTSSNQQTYLRVKRRRSSAISSTLRLEEGLKGRKRGHEDNNHGAILDSLTDMSIAQSVNSNASSSLRSSGRRKAAIWKRVDLKDADKSHPVHFLNALLEEEEGEESAQTKPSVKRRRLTLLPTDTHSKDDLMMDASGSNSKTNKKKKVPYKVLDPVERLVDDSLQKVHLGQVSIEQHVHFVITDPRLADQSRKWLAWSNENSSSCCGNLLHACALWNNAAVARDLLRRELEGLADALDAEGRTPYEVAELSGHDAVAQILEAFGADTSNYVFDIYCLDNMNTDQPQELDQDLHESSTTALELEGGYWDGQRGELVLDDAQKGSFGNERYEDDAVDSNDEDWSGNDYPDDDAGGVWNNNDDDDEESDDESDNGPDGSFRRRPVRLGDPNGDEGMFDVSYGIYGQSEPEYDREI